MDLFSVEWSSVEWASVEWSSVEWDVTEHHTNIIHLQLTRKNDNMGFTRVRFVLRWLSAIRRNKAPVESDRSCV